MPLPKRIAVIAVITLVASLESRAQAQRLLGPDPNREARQGVYVHDSAIVQERFALAQRMERLKEWDKSADVYQEIVEKFADSVVPISGDNDPPGTQRYASVSMKVQELLGKWPDEGLKRYRARYETSAAALLESANLDDVAALSRVMQRYFATDAAKSAGFRLIELYIENGEFPAAAWVGERLLVNHPGVTDAERPKLLFRTALAEHLGSDDSAAKRNADELKNRFGAATGVVRGQDVVLADELTKILAAPPAVARGGSSPDVWPIFGGDATRGRVPAAAARPSARLPATIEMRTSTTLTPRSAAAAAAAAAVAAAGGQNNDQSERSLRDQGALLNIMPVVDRGEVFFQDGQRIYAKGLESGLTLPGWTTYAGTDDTPTPLLRTAAAAQLNSLVASNGAQFTVTLTDTSVLAVLRVVKSQQQDFNGNQLPIISTPLVCHDRATGAQRWSIAPDKFPQTQQQNLRDLELCGSPLVVGDNVYVAARGGRVQQTENAYVLCIGLNDGKLKWACYLASGNSFFFNTGMPGSSMASHLAYAGGRIYAVTNIGAVAAVDAYSGTIVWLTLYPRLPQFSINAMGGGVVVSGSSKPWSQNAAIVKDGKVFCLPSDARFLLIYDAGTGAEVKRIELTGDFENVNTLLAVMHDTLIVNSLNRVFCINWTADDPGKLLKWPSATLTGPSTEKDSKDTIRGRGFVTEDSVFIPTSWNLRRLDLKGGRVLDTYPGKDQSWAKDEGPGNVLVTSDQVIIAGSYSLRVYSDFGLGVAKLDREVQAMPNDPLPRLRYAETLFAARDVQPGSFEKAVEKLDQAIDLLGGLNSMRPGPARERVFARSLAFADRAADPTSGPRDLERANALFDRAAAAAYTPQQQVTWRLRRANFSRERRDRDLATDVRLCQEILANPTWRTTLVSLSDDGIGALKDGSAGGVKQAGVVAEGRIEDAIGQDKNVYVPFEKAAADALAAAQAHNHPLAMLAVAQTFPNSKKAPEAMLAAAQAFEDVKNNREATRVLAEAYRKFHEQKRDALPSILEAQARNYLLIPGGMDAAIGRLNEAARIPNSRLSHPLKLSNGETIAESNTLMAEVAFLLQLQAKREAQAMLPEFNLPRQVPGGKGIPLRDPFLPEAPESIIADCDQLVLPPRELRNRTRFDRIVTWTKDRGISVYAIGGSAPLGTAAVGDNKTPPRGAIWFGNDLVVWANDAVHLFKGDGLGQGWRVPIGTMDIPEVVEGDPAVIRMAPAAPAPGDNPGVGPGAMRGFGRPNFRLGIVGPAPAVPAPGPGQRAAQGTPEQVLSLRPVGDRVVFATNYGRIAAIDTATGQLAWQTRIADSLTDKDQIVSNDDFLAARYATPEGPRIVALDAYAGQIVYGDVPGNDLPVQNLTLSPDGLLVYTLPDRVRVKDLFEPGKSLKFRDVPVGDANANNRPFEGCSGPEQLVVSEGRILALADHGQRVRVISPDDGRKLDDVYPLSTGARQEYLNSTLRVVGTHLYIFHDRLPQNYDLDHPANFPYRARGEFAVIDAFVAKQYLVLVTTQRPTEPDPEFKKDRSFTLLAFARYPSRPERNDESGKLDHEWPVVYPTEITQWQPVEGGIYYCGADRRAHFLKGAGTPQTTQPAGQAGTQPATHPQ